ncbi:MAG TPA: hypothetical protein VNH84_16010 [Candidatus Saccharimonadales bacterium]|nr:hypothetical protein [Candidatus Saccharimonadales bacterium]
MTNPQTQWLAPVPWESVIALNKALCQAQKMEPLTRSAELEKAQRRWEQACAKSMNLRDALQTCREAHDLSPFVFNNGNTFAAVGQTLIADLLKQIPPVEAQIFRTTVGHYIAGLIGRNELLSVLRHLEPMLKFAPPAPTPAPAPAPAAAPAPEPTPEPVALRIPRQQGA